MRPVRLSKTPQVRPQVKLGAGLQDCPFEQWVVESGVLSRSSSPGFPVVLPLGHRAFEKFRDVIRNAANTVGFEEYQLPSLYPVDLLEASGRRPGFSDRTIDAAGVDAALVPLGHAVHFQAPRLFVRVA